MWSGQSIAFNCNVDQDLEASPSSPIANETDSTAMRQFKIAISLSVNVEIPPSVSSFPAQAHKGCHQSPFNDDISMQLG
jgi:hypothetical protein